MKRIVNIHSQDPTHIYYNIDILNNDTSNEGKSLFLQFDETRTGDFLQEPKQYFLSVVRFALQSPSLPVFIPQIDPSAGVNDTIYYVTINNGVSNFTERVIYIPEDLSITPPTTSNPQDNSRSYYNVKSYESFFQMVNNAIGSASLLAGTGARPYLRYDSETGLVDFFIPEAFYSSGYKIFFNNPLETLLAIFPYQKSPIGGFGGEPLAVHEFIVYPTYKLETISGTAYYVKTSENSPVSLLNPISSIVFTSTRLPVLKSFTGVPKIFNSTQNLSSQGNNDNLTSILTDFSVPLSRDNSYRPNIDYQPQGEYRLSDLIGDNALNAVHLEVFWKDKYGNLNPFLLNSNCGASLKLMFRKRTFNSIM